MKHDFHLSLPLLASLAATRALIGFGAGLLLSPRISRRRRRPLALTMIALGAASTVPLGLGLRLFGAR